MNPLAELKDIHLAPDQPWWPPAPGWWLLAALALLLLAVVLRWLIHRYKIQVRRRRIIGFFNHIWVRYQQHGDRRLLAADLDTGLRRLALQRFDRAQVAGLSGEPWLDFWRSRDKAVNQDDAAVQPLLLAPYAPAPSYDAQRLFDQVMLWVRQHA